MSPRPPTTGGRAGAAAVLLLAGLLCWGLFRVISGTEHHAYSAGAVPPVHIRVTATNQYTLSVPGGVAALKRRNVALKQAQCAWSTNGSALQALPVSTDPNTKATEVVGTFIAPITGDIHIECSGWGPVFVDDANNATGDPAGYFLVLAMITLTLGVGFGLSALRTSTAGRPSRAAREYDEIEGAVHLGDVLREHGEVGGGDPGDVQR